MRSLNCPVCCQGTLEYLGIDDGFGDFGNQFLDIYKCSYCEARIPFDPESDLIASLDPPAGVPSEPES